jgi:hypothetical protein
MICLSAVHSTCDNKLSYTKHGLLEIFEIKITMCAIFCFYGHKSNIYVIHGIHSQINRYSSIY